MTRTRNLGGLSTIITGNIVSNTTTVSGNLIISNATTQAGIVFPDGTFLITSSGGGGGGGTGPTGPTGPGGGGGGGGTGPTGPTGPQAFSAYTKTTFTATQGQTTFTVSYAVGYIDVWYNGVKLGDADFTATNGTSIVLTSAAVAGSIIETIAWAITGIGGTGPTGPLGTGPTGPASTVTGPASTVTGPTGPAGSPLPRVSTSTTITSPLAWNSNTYDQYSINAQTEALTINADLGSPQDGQKALFRIKDDGTSRALTWTTVGSKSFRVIGTTLPTATIVNKVVYVGIIYNANADTWDVIAVGQQA
jgi:hypothetical protein